MSVGLRAYATRLKNQIAVLKRRVSDLEKQNKLCEVRISVLQEQRVFYAEQLKAATCTRRTRTREELRA